MKSYSSIDLCKFIASILVVAIHTKPFAQISDDADYYFTCLCRIAVPFFFITTSFFFFRKEKPDIKRYTQRLLVLYMVWFLIEFPFVYKRFFIDYDNSLLLQLLNFVRCLIFNNTWFASWFIMACILSVNIIYYLSKKLSNKYLFIIGWGGYIISLSCSSYSGALDYFLSDNLQHIHAQISYFFMPANSFIVALIYIVLGKIIADKMQNDNKKILTPSHNIYLLVITFVLLCAEIHFMKWSVIINDAFFLLPLFATLSLICLIETNLKIPQYKSHLMRSISILIYILHAVFVSINPILFNVGSGIIMFVITLFESFIAAYIIIYLSNNITILKKLY